MRQVPPLVDQEWPQKPAASAQRRAIYIVGAIIAFFVAVAFASVSLSSGDGESALAATKDAQPDTDESELEPQAEDIGEPPPTVTYEVYLARDPFEPVREPVVDEPSPDDREVGDPVDPTSPGASDPTDPTEPGAPPPDDPVAPQPSDPDDPDADRCVGEEERVCNGRVVSLLDINERNGQRVAEIQVDTQIYTVAPGEVFATQFRLLSIEGDCVWMEFGSHTFDQCVGERTLK